MSQAEYSLHVNSRYVHQPLTGVQRYAVEITKRLKRPVTKEAPRRPMRGFKAHAWEQFRLPLKLPNNSLLWSPCNTGPLAVRNQIVTIHDTAFLDVPNAFSASFRAYYQWLMPKLASRVRGVLTVSNFSKTRICESFGLNDSQITVAPCGVGDEFFEEAPLDISIVKSDLNIEKRAYILLVGSIEPRKNLATAFQAWQQLTQYHDDFELVVAGGTADLFRRTDTEIPINANFVGRVSDEQLRTLLINASCFLFPSLYEGFGLPPLEALAAGCPVISSDRCSMPEVLGNAVLYFDPTSSEDLAATLAKSLDDSELRNTMSTIGKAHAQNFTWQNSADIAESLFDRIAVDHT